jgi:MerR family copper efflux transcriptional regulator
MTEIQSLLKFWLDTDRESRNVKKLADKCDGNDNPDCPILEGLAQ